MNADRPTILITRAETIPGQDWEDYARCVAAAGGDPRAVEVTGPLDASALPVHAGVVVTGGVDIDPARYGETRSERVTEVNPARDEAEAALIQHALRAGIPLFCICRGFQLLNVVRGGTLLQHLEEREPHRARRGADGAIESGWHEVTVTAGSRLASITGRATLRVNSLHHQAVEQARVAPGLLVAAVAPDGVVEALEVPGHPWALGVQWHPERVEMTADPALAIGAVPLFEAFIAACRQRGGG